MAPSSNRVLFCKYARIHSPGVAVMALVKRSSGIRHWGFNMLPVHIHNNYNHLGLLKKFAGLKPRIRSGHNSLSFSPFSPCFATNIKGITITNRKEYPVHQVACNIACEDYQKFFWKLIAIVVRTT